MIKKLRYLFTLMLLLVASVSWADDKTIVASALTDGVLTDAPYTLTFNKQGGTTAPTYNEKGGDLRLYAKGTVKISTTGDNMTKIVFNLSDAGLKRLAPITASVGSVVEQSVGDETVIWTGNANEVTFTVGDKADFGSEGSSKAGQLCFSSVVISTGEITPIVTIPAPVLSPEAGEVASGTTVTISNLNTSYLYYYTDNGVDPAVDEEGLADNESTKAFPTTGVTLTAATTLKVLATDGEGHVSNITTAAYTIAEPEGNYRWEEVALEDLIASDVFVIVGNNGNNFALANDKGTAAAPTAVAVTVENSKITSTVSNNIKWTVSGDATNGYTFNPNGNTEEWLYCTNTNNGVRVGTNDSKTFKIDGGYLKHDGTSRYVGVYNSQDWRCYTSKTGTSNIANQTFKFYKRVSDDTPEDPYISAADVEIAYDATSGTIAYEIKNAEGGTMAATTTATWLTIGTVGETVPFTCTVNSDAAARTATVTLTYTYGEETLTEEVIVTQAANPNAPGTADNPYTVAQARAAIDAGTGVTGVYATGIVSAIPTAYSSEYKNITFNFVDNEGDTDFLQAYRCKGDDAANVVVGATVVVKGNLTKYGSTYEFGAGCELVSLILPAVAVPEFSVKGGVYYEAQSVELTCETEGATIKYSTDNDTWTNYTAPIAVSETTTIYAKAVKGTSESIVASAKYEIRDAEMKGGPNNPYTVAEALEVEPIEGVYVSGIISEIKSIDVSQYKRAQYYISDDGTTDNQLYIYNGYYLNGAAFTANDQIQEGDVVTVYGNLIVYNDVKQIDQNGYIVSIKRPAEDVTVTITDAGYATFVAPVAVTFGGSAVKAYEVTEIGASSVTFNEVTEVPAGAAVVVEGSAGTYGIAKATGDVAKLTNNKLVAATEDINVTTARTYYVLNVVDGVVGFYPIKEGKTIAAGKGYFVKEAGAKFYGIDDDATGINDINVNDNVNANDAIYSISGQRLQKLQRGINIVNGKKIVVK